MTAIDWDAEWQPGDRVRSDATGHGYELVCRYGSEFGADRWSVRSTTGGRSGHLLVPFGCDVTPSPPAIGDKVRVIGEPGIAVCKETDETPNLHARQALIVRHGREYWVPLDKVRSQGPWKVGDVAWTRSYCGEGPDHERVEVMRTDDAHLIEVRGLDKGGCMARVATELFTIQKLQVGDHVRHWRTGHVGTVEHVFPRGESSVGAWVQSGPPRRMGARQGRLGNDHARRIRKHYHRTVPTVANRPHRRRHDRPSHRVPCTAAGA